MSVRNSLVLPAASVLLAMWSYDTVRADDFQVVPPPLGGQYSAPASGCAACAAAKATSTSKSCPNCGSSWFHHHEKGPYVVNLCPGACFGYFQTQWRKWDDVCPYPYQGVGVSDAPRPSSPALPPLSKPDGTLPAPRTVEPKAPELKPMSSSALPPVPSTLPPLPTTLPPIPVRPSGF
jgi:hypothetical protein